MLTNQFQFVNDCLEKEMSWKETTINFNKEYRLGLSSEALRKRYQREISRLETLGDDPVEKAFNIVKRQPQKPADLAKRFNLDIEGLQELLDDLLNSRTAIKFHQGYLVFDRLAPKPDDFIHHTNLFETGEWFKFGIISDTHFCSIHEEIEAVHHFYKLCEEEKCIAMLHAGDFTAGSGTVYRGQYQDLKIVGVDKQVDYVCSIWPDTTLETYAISGNHEKSYYDQSGIEMINLIADRIDNLHYLGKMNAVLESNGLRINLRHGEGGLSGVRSYKPQRILDSYRADDICDIFILGHYHVFLHMPKYRNSIVILPGCFESQSDYLIKKSLTPDVGGVILEVQVGKINGVNKIIRHRTEFFDYGELLGK